MKLFAASERGEYDCARIYRSFHTRLFLARDISFYEKVVHRSAVKCDRVCPHAGLPDVLLDVANRNLRRV